MLTLEQSAHRFAGRGHKLAVVLHAGFEGQNAVGLRDGTHANLNATRNGISLVLHSST